MMELMVCRQQTFKKKLKEKTDSSPVISFVPLKGKSEGRMGQLGDMEGPPFIIPL